MWEVWQASSQERSDTYPCDAMLAERDFEAWRAIDVDAPVDRTFRWLCQLRVAPYSYDWIDNPGHRSPPTLSEGLEDPQRGQSFMRIFELVEYELNRHITLRIRDPKAQRVFGEVFVSYCVRERDMGARIVVKLVACSPRNLIGALLKRILPFGDWVMMRKQLRTLKRYAETSSL